jgi:hypothetical protein
MRRAAAAVFAAAWLAFAPAPAVASDLARMAPMIDVQGLIDGDVTLAGGRIAVEAEIAGDLVATGASIGIGAATRVARNVFLFGGEIAMAGRYAQRVWAAGGEVVLDIAAAGDVSLAAGRVVVGPNTRIAGKLRVWSPDPPLIHASAEIAGGVAYARNPVAACAPDSGRLGPRDRQVPPDRAQGNAGAPRPPRAPRRPTPPRQRHRGGLSGGKRARTFLHWGVAAK